MVAMIGVRSNPGTWNSTWASMWVQGVPNPALTIFCYLPKHTITVLDWKWSS